MEGVKQVISRYYYDDLEAAASCLRQFSRYKSASGPMRSNALIVACAKDEQTTPWCFWEDHGEPFPELQELAMTVLSCQSGIGASERAHKITKAVLPSHKSAKKASTVNRSVYVRCNLPLLDKFVKPTYTIPFVPLYEEPESSPEPEEPSTQLVRFAAPLDSDLN